MFKKKNKKEKIKFKDLDTKGKIMRVLKKIALILGIVIAFLAVVLVIAAIVIRVSFGIWIFPYLTPNNIKAGWTFITNDRAQIEEKLNENTQNQADALNQSPEVIAAISSGNYTEEEIELILNTNGAAIAEIDARKKAQENDKAESTEPSVSDDIANDNTDITPSDTNEVKDESDAPSPDDTADKPIENVPDEGKDVTPVVQPEVKVEPEVIPDVVPETVPEPSKDPVVETVPVNDAEPETDSELTDVPESGTTDNEPVVPAVNQAEIINKSAAKLYVVKTEFVSQLADIEKVIRRAYCDLPIEQQVPSSRKEIAGRYIKAVSDLELECDAKVDSILAELKSELEAVGGDLSVIDTIRKQYEEEKSLKKAYYLDVYRNGLPDNEKKG